MAVKHKSLYLYLTLACFIGIILIFIFDGYLGVYDSLNVKAGENPYEKIEADQWLQRYGDFSTVVEWGGKAFFRYELDNRWFSAYVTSFEVSVLHEQEQVAVLMSQPFSVGSFDKGEFEWVLDTAALIPAGAPPAQGYDFTVVIKRGEIERRFIVHVGSSDNPIKVIPPPNG
jgi:hypothetical protein